MRGDEFICFDEKDRKLSSLHLHTGTTTPIGDLPTLLLPSNQESDGNDLLDAKDGKGIGYDGDVNEIARGDEPGALPHHQPPLTLYEHFEFTQIELHIIRFESQVTDSSIDIDLRSGMVLPNTSLIWYPAPHLKVERLKNEMKKFCVTDSKRNTSCLIVYPAARQHQRYQFYAYGNLLALVSHQGRSDLYGNHRPDCFCLSVFDLDQRGNSNNSARCVFASNAGYASIYHFFDTPYISLGTNTIYSFVSNSIIEIAFHANPTACIWKHYLLRYEGNDSELRIYDLERKIHGRYTFLPPHAKLVKEFQLDLKAEECGKLMFDGKHLLFCVSGLPLSEQVAFTFVNK